MLALTYRCNAHCTMCDVWRLSDHGYELEPELFAKFPTCLRNVNITGGEPFMRKEIAQIIGVLRKSNPKLRMVISTNGLAPKLIRPRPSHRAFCIGFSPALPIQNGNPPMPPTQHLPAYLHHPESHAPPNPTSHASSRRAGRQMQRSGLLRRGPSPR